MTKFKAAMVRDLPDCEITTDVSRAIFDGNYSWLQDLDETQLDNLIQAIDACSDCHGMDAPVIPARLKH